MLRSCVASLRSLELTFIHIDAANGWVTIISELPRILKLNDVRLGHCLSEGFGSQEYTWSLDLDPWVTRQSTETAREIQSLVLRTEEIHLEETCEEIRTLMWRLKEELVQQEEEDEAKMEEIIAQCGGYDAVWDEEEEEEDDDDDNDDEGEDTDEEDTEVESQGLRAHWNLLGLEHQ